MGAVRVPLPRPSPPPSGAGDSGVEVSLSQVTPFLCQFVATHDLGKKTRISLGSPSGGRTQVCKPGVLAPAPLGGSIAPADVCLRPQDLPCSSSRHLRRDLFPATCFLRPQAGPSGQGLRVDPGVTCRRGRGREEGPVACPAPGSRTGVHGCGGPGTYGYQAEGSVSRGCRAGTQREEAASTQHGDGGQARPALEPPHSAPGFRG